MWDRLKAEVKGWNTNLTECYILNFGFTNTVVTSDYVYAVDMYGHGEYFCKC